jgi:hypothetical protein
MTYALLSDDLMLRLEASGVSRDARLLHVEAIVYCATALTDGDVRIRLPRISDAEDTDGCADELVEAGLWERIAGGYRVLDGMEHQRSRDEVELAREAARERKERSRRHKLGDHSMCLKGRYCPDGRVTRDRTRDGTRDGTPTNPIQSDPRKDKDWKGGRSADGALERAPASPAKLRQPHGLDGDDLCKTCGLSDGHQVHDFRPSQAQHIIDVLTARGGRMFDPGTYVPADGDDEATWSVAADWPDCTVYCDSADCDPYTYGRLAKVHITFAATPEEFEQVAEAGCGWPATKITWSDTGHLTVVTETAGADLLPSLHAIVDRAQAAVRATREAVA